MGFGLKRTVRKVKQKMGPFGFMLDPLNLSKKSNSGEPGPDFGFRDPSTIAPPPTDLSTPFQPPAQTRRSLKDILSDESFSAAPTDAAFQFSEGPVGPGVEDDSAAYDAFLKSGEAARAREEARGTENVLGQLQGRGLVRSGIALKDIVNQVIGPSSERAGQLAATFGLERARRRSDLLESERGAARRLNEMRLGGRQKNISQRLGGRLQAILSGEDAASAMDRANLGGAFDLRRQGLQGQQDFALTNLRGAQNERLLDLENQIGQRQAMEDRRRKRKGALLGLLGGAAGGYFGGPVGASVGSQAGQQMGDLF